jgi:hypothetical protein
MIDTEATCTIRKQVCTDAHVIAEFPAHWGEYGRLVDGKMRPGTPEDFGKFLDNKCKEFEQFLRDHRSQDMVQLDVVRHYSDLCSACGREWEEMDDDGICCCASCGAKLIKE